MVFGVLDSNGVALGSERAAFRGEPLGTGGVLILSSGLLLAVAALPILLSPSSSPILKEPPTLPFRRLMSISPLGVMGCFGSGLLVAALYVLAPVYGAELGMSRLEIGSLVAAMVIGALALHWPLARLSCAFGRRLVLIGALLGAVIGSVAMIGLSAQAAYLSMLAGLLTGGFVFSIFPLALSHACDWVHVRERQAVMGGLIPVWGIGAIIGPSLGAIAIERAGPPGLFMCVAVVCVLLVCFGFFRVTMRSSDKGVHRMTFALIPQHGLFFSAAMHRPDIDHQHSFDFDGGNTGGVDARGNQIRTKPGESE
ncbi:MAG: MFS transporter [Pseudomonadota bacterium]